MCRRSRSFDSKHKEANFGVHPKDEMMKALAIILRLELIFISLLLVSEIEK